MRIESMVPVVIIAVAGLAGCAPPAAMHVYDEPLVRGERVQFGVVQVIGVASRGSAAESPSVVGEGDDWDGPPGPATPTDDPRVTPPDVAVMPPSLIRGIRDQEHSRYRVVVLLDSGDVLGAAELGDGGVHVGDRVRVINNCVFRA